MHVLLIHQAFATIHEPGGTRHHELALYLADCGHRITIITSTISYLTGRKIDSDSKYSDQYNKLVIEAMGGINCDNDNNENKIIKRVTKEIVVNKEN